MTENILKLLVEERDRIQGAIDALGAVEAVRKPRKARAPLSEETKQKMRDSWAKRNRAKKRAAK